MNYLFSKNIAIALLAISLTSCASSENAGKVESLLSPGSQTEVETTTEPQTTEAISQSSTSSEINQPKTISQSASGITPQQINRRVKQFTVRIDGASNGSGVIVEQSDNTYTVLTNWHVVQEAGNYTIQTSDGRQHQVNYQQVEQLPGVDLALVKFASEENYQTAKFGDSDYLNEGQGVHLAGYPGVIVNNDRIYRFYNLNVVSLLDTPTEEGYSVLYEGDTISGMSGSPLLDGKGNLVGIHGLYRVEDPKIRKGSSYAIPINTYKELVAEQSESSEEVASQSNTVTTSKPNPILIKKSTKPAESQKTITQKQADNIVAHQEGHTSEAIDTQPGPGGTHVQLLSAKVAGQILNVTILYVKPDEDYGNTGVNYPIDDVSYIDDNTAQQYGVLKNESGKYLASPKQRETSNSNEVDLEEISLRVYSGKSEPAWFKFPAPSPETQTISINIPEVGPFVGVPVQR